MKSVNWIIHAHSSLWLQWTLLLFSFTLCINAVCKNDSYAEDYRNSVNLTIGSMRHSQSIMLMKHDQYGRHQFHTIRRLSYKPTNSALLYISLVLLSSCSDIELNPGPLTSGADSPIEISHPEPESFSTCFCGACKEPVTWDSAEMGILCEDCDTWFHGQCQGIHESTYNRLGDTSAPWTCRLCAGVNYSSVLFDIQNNSDLPPGTSLDDARLSGLDDSSMSADSFNSQNMSSPMHTSSPNKPRPNPKSGKRPLRIINVNCRSLVKKKGPFYNLVNSTRPDIIILTETWFHPGILTSEYFGPQYVVHRRDRCKSDADPPPDPESQPVPSAEKPLIEKRQIGGGVIIAVNSDYTSSKEETLMTDSAEILWVKVNMHASKHLYVGACYRPSETDNTTTKALNTSLTRLTNNKNNQIFLGGDFNLPDYDWKNKCMKPHARYVANYTEFAEAIDDAGLNQLIEESTHAAGNTLDLMLTNRPRQVNRIEVIPGISDHAAVYAELNVQPMRRKQTPRLVPIYSKANWDALKQSADKIAADVKKNERKMSCEQLWSLFHSGLEKAIKEHIPHRQIKTNASAPWINEPLRKKMRRRDKAYKKSKKRGSPSQEAKFKTLKMEVQRDLRKAYWEYVESIITPSEDESTPFASMKRFWKFIKNQKTDHEGVSTLKVGGKLISEPREKAEALNTQFQSVFTKETPFKGSPPKRKPRPMRTINITSNGVKKLMKSLKPNKAAGPDRLSPRVLKELSDHLADPLTRIFKKSLNEGNVPKDWRHALVAPIYKNKGSRSDPVNYRPISLTSVCCKMMEHIVCSHIMKHADDNDLLYPLQHGFRKQRSCETQLNELVHDLAKNMSEGHQTDVIVLDFAKAFDKVGHERLLQQLNWYGVTGQTNNWIRSFLSNRTQTVVVDGCCSDSKPVTSGVPQGSVLGPCLFLYYINDIAKNMNGTVRLFADDTMIYLTITNEADASRMQEDLNTLSKWEHQWMMEFHPDKCEVLSVSRKQNTVKYPYTLNGHLLKHVDFVKYLGVHITKDLSWDRHTSHIASKATNTLNFLRRNIQVSNSKIKGQAYKSLVRPQMEYAQVVWDPIYQDHAKKLEAVQRRAARFTLGRYRRSSSVGEMLTSLEWPLLTQRRHDARLAMFYKIHYGLVASPMPLILKGHHEPTRNENTQAYHIPRAGQNYFRDSFFLRTARVWNGLPESTVRAETLTTFKSSLPPFPQ